MSASERLEDTSVGETCILVSLASLRYAFDCASSNVSGSVDLRRDCYTHREFLFVMGIRAVSGSGRTTNTRFSENRNSGSV